MNDDFLTIDVMNDGLLLGHIPNLENLYLPLAEANKPSAERVVQHLDANFDKELVHGKGVVLGYCEDPFHPFEGRFDTSLRALEQLAAAEPSRVIIQTRSPLVVLALPILKALGDRVSVEIPIEAVNDSIHQHFAAGYPRPSERVKAARALKRFGIWTAIQVTPIAWERDSRNELSRFAETLVDISCEIKIFAFPDAGSAHPSRPVASRGGRSFKTPRRKLCRDAHSILREALKRLSTRDTDPNTERSLAA